jgi:glycosyltransferase involved in cell wall biosynthesis
VSFASGGTPEAVESGASGYLLPEGDEKGLAQKITALLQNSLLWQEMSVEGKRRMAERFDLRVQTRILEAKYDEVIARYAQVSSERSILQA